MKTTVNVHLLPIKETKGSNIVKILPDTISYTTTNNIPGGIYQHIYFTSPQSDLKISKIKEGDYCINIINKTIRQSDHNVDYEQNHWEKIIACTDYSLKITIPNATVGYSKVTSVSIPWIPQSFIEHYITEYNKDNVIKTAEIKLEDCGTKDKDSLGIIEHTDTDGFGFYMRCRLKLNSSNEVIVVPTIDKMYSRDEVIDLLHKSLDASVTKNSSFRHIFERQLDEWIKENII